MCFDTWHHVYTDISTKIDHQVIWTTLKMTFIFTGGWTLYDHQLSWKDLVHEGFILLTKYTYLRKQFTLCLDISLLTASILLLLRLSKMHLVPSPVLQLKLAQIKDCTICCKMLNSHSAKVRQSSPPIASEGFTPLKRTHLGSEIMLYE